MSKKELNAKNPCIRDCEYDDNNICIACHRTKKEIFEWGDYTDKERIVINKRIIEEFGN